MDYQTTFSSIVDNLARQMRPTTYREVLEMATELWIGCPQYRQGITKGVSFFMTELEVYSKDDKAGDEVRQARDLLNERFATTDQPMLALLEAFGFGGCCVYLQMPIDRVLSCTCGHTMPMDSGMCDHGVAFSMEDGRYSGTCPGCRKRVKYRVTDNKRPNEAHEAKLLRIPLSLCRMSHNPVTDERDLYFNCKLWDMFANGVKSGDPLFHRSTPGIFIESARTGDDIRLNDKFFHYIGFSDASLIDMQLGGWSLPPFFYAFPDVIAILLLQKYNQTILKDYVTPSRYVAPPPTVGVARSLGGEGQPFDPTHSSAGSFSDFSSRVSRALRAMRADPSKIGVFPYPVQFGYMGLDGKQLLAPELLQHHIDSLMWDIGVPSEFYRGGLQAQVATPTQYNWILFERTWRPLIHNIVKLHRWVARRVGASQGWPEALQVSLVPPNVHHAPEVLPLMYQRNQEGKLSDETFDRALGVDGRYERRTVMREMEERESAMSDADRRHQRKAIAGQMLDDVSPLMQALQQVQAGDQAAMAPGAPGGMPPAPAPVPPSAPGAPVPPQGSPGAGVNAAEQPALQAVRAKAAQKAQELVSGYPNAAERGAMLRELSAQQPDFGVFVAEEIARIENEARKQGLQMVRGGGGPM